MVLISLIQVARPATMQLSEIYFLLTRIYGPLILHLKWRALTSGQSFCESLSQKKIPLPDDFSPSTRATVNTYQAKANFGCLRRIRDLEGQRDNKLYKSIYSEDECLYVFLPPPQVLYSCVKMVS